MSKIGEQISEALSRFESDFGKYENGNHSAGVRARKALMEIKKIAADGRKELSAMNPKKKSAVEPSEEAAA